MLFEPILLGVTLATTSIFLLSGCSSKKKTAAPSVPKSPVNPPGKSPVSASKSPVSKSPAKDTETKDTTTQGETKDTNGETKDTQGETKETKDTGTTKGDETKDDDETKKDKEDKDEKKKKDKKKKSDEKDDEEGDKKKEDDDKDDDKRDEDKDKKTKKKETFISVDPNEIVFETAITSQKKLRLKNLTSKKVMFKIKASTTNVYLINPVFGKIEPNGTADVTITHRPSAKREDKLVIVSSEMQGKEIEMAKTFKQIKSTGTEVIVKLVAG